MKLAPAQDYRIIPEYDLQDHCEANREWPCAKLFGHALVRGERSQMARHIVARVNARDRSTINFVNAHCINVEKREPHYRAALKDSDLLLPDGIGMEIAAKMAGQKLGDNLNGTDLLPELCREAQEEGVGIFFLGGEPGVAHAAADWAARHYPALRIAGAQNGFFSPCEEDALIELINASFGWHPSRWHGRAAPREMDRAQPPPHQCSSCDGRGRPVRLLFGPYPPRA